MNDYSIYGIAGNPFQKGNNNKAAFQAKDHKEAMGVLGKAKKEGGLAVITAAPGMGKSYALKCFTDSLDIQKHTVHYVTLSTVSITEFYRQISESFKLDIKYGKAAMYRAIKDRIQELYKANYMPIIIVDEAQDLNFAVLRELKSLLSFQMDTRDYCLFILAGEPRLNTTLQKSIHESLHQRIRYHYHFKGLSVKENIDYVKYKIMQAGGSVSLLSDEAYELLPGLTKGNARITDQIMTNALSIGVQHNRTVIDAEVLQAASDSLKLG